MKCKNCSYELIAESNYCSHCGAVVVKERISVKGLFSSVLEAFGWDSRFFITLRDLLIRPHLIFSRYLNGTRKRYTNPFTFFAIGAALSVLVINFYFDEMLEIAKEASQHQNETFYGPINNNAELDASTHSAEFREKVEGFTEKLFVFQFKYYYYVSFLLLPIYTLIAFWVFGKPYNFGEHLVINAFIQGILLLLSLVLILLAIAFKADALFNITILLTVVYYSFAYTLFYKLNFWQLVRKLLKFLGIVIAIFLVLAIGGAIIGMLTMNQ